MNKKTTSSSYHIHPSHELVEKFKKRPYQGQHPEKASVIILGNDANYSAQISNSSFFQRILEYHEDGIAFWKNHKVHHPFLHKDYPLNKREGGVAYHRNFAKLNLLPEHAEKVSFVELLDIPVIGNTNNSTFKQLMKLEHIQWLEYSMLTGCRKIILLSPSFFNVLPKLQKSFSCFMNFPLMRPPLQGMLTKRCDIKEVNNLALFSGYHFSAPGKKRGIHGIINEISDALVPFLQ